MKRNLQVVMMIALMAIGFASQAQVRYLDEVFTDAQIQVDTSIQYAQNYEYYTSFSQLKPLIMDVYSPASDTATKRPVILLSHNGSFLPEGFTHAALGLCFNGRKDSSITELCRRFAKRGYIAVSFDYRLGWNATAGDQITRTKTIIQAVYRAMQDAKALVRYFKNDYSTANTWHADTSRIVIGGSNSGAYVALAASALNDTNELNQLKFTDINGPFLKQDTVGDFDGFGGAQNYSGNYPGISSRYQVTLSLGGAVGDTSWIQPGETPIIAFHGVAEASTPFNTGVVVTSTGQPVIEVSGSGDFMPIVDALGNNNPFLPNSFLQGPPNRNGQGQQTTSIEGLYPFYSEKFEPWNWWDTSCYNGSVRMVGLTTDLNGVGASIAKGNRYIDTIMAYTMPRLYKIFYQPTGINEIGGDIQVTLYPNPATTDLTVLMSDKYISSIQMFDITGRLVKEANNINANRKTLNVNGMQSGVYIMTLKLTDGTTAARRVNIGN